MVCTWNDCNKSENLIKVDNKMVCEFHKNGGIFYTGELFEQYAIIEEDFINILKYIPLEKENLNIHSPRFSDILIRCCVSIEIFFREWLNHFAFSENKDILKLRSRSRLEFKDFYKVFHLEVSDSFLEVRHLDEKIYPFIKWKEGQVPDWWDVYNKIKHHKPPINNKANLDSALNAIGALFLLHCEQVDSLSYLYKYSSSALISSSWTRLRYIKTPLESKRYLFLYSIRMQSPSHQRSREK